MLRRALTIAALLLFCQSANAQDLADFDLDTAVEAANLLEQAESFRLQIENTVTTLKQANAAQAIGTAGPVRDAAQIAINNFAAPFIDKALQSKALSGLLNLGNQLDGIRSEIKALNAKLKGAQQQVQVSQRELDLLKSSLQPYQALTSKKGRLAFAKNQLAKALERPIDIDVGGGKTITIQVLDGTDTVFGNPGKLALRVQYKGGLAATIKGVKVLDQEPWLDFSGTHVDVDRSSITSASQEILGDVVKGLDIPLPMKIEDIDYIQSGADAPKLTLSVSAQFPGLNEVVELMKSNGGKVQASFVVNPTVKSGMSLSDIVTYNDDLKLILATGSELSIPLGSGLQYIAKGLEFRNRDKMTQKVINQLTVLGVIGPMPLNDPDQGVSLNVNISLNLAGRPQIVMTGDVLALNSVVGNFECSISTSEVVGSITFPAKGPIADVYAKAYRGNFRFKLTKESLTADGLAVIFSVLKSNFALYLSLNGGDSSLESHEKISLGAINAESTLFASLKNHYKDLRMDVALWCDVDLVIYKPKARVEIAATMTGIPAKAIAAAAGNPSALLAFDTLDLKASALGLTVSWSPDVKELSSINLSEIENRLRKQTDNMLNRLSSAAADWEKDKRELLSRWEDHWADTLSAQAKKYGLNKINTGIKPLDDFFGRVADTGKNVGEWFGKVSQGMGSAWTSGRDSVGSAYTDARDEVEGWFGVGNQQQTADQIVTAIFRKWCDLSAGSRPPQGTDPGFAPAAVYDLEKVAGAVRDSVSDDGRRKDLAKIFASRFGSTGYGSKLSKAITDGKYDTVANSEAIAFGNAMQASSWWFANTPTQPPDAGSSVDFDNLVKQFNRVDVLRERVEGDRVRQIHIAFDDCAVSRDAQQNVTVGFIARISGVFRAGEDHRAAANLVPITVVFHPVLNGGDAYSAELQIPDVTLLTDRQFEWMKAKPDTRSTPAAPTTDAEYDGLDRSILSVGDEAQQRAKIQVFLKSVFDGDAPSGNAHMNSNGIVRLAMESLLQRVVPQVTISAQQFQHQKRIAIRNMTPEPLKVRMKARQRKTANSSFQWLWNPSPPNSGANLEFAVAPGPNSVTEMRVDLGDQADDFGAVTPPLLASRLRLDASSADGEQWNFINEDIFVVDVDPTLGNERVYEGATSQLFLFTIQSSRVPAIQLVKIFQNNRASVEHRGSATSTFDIPARSGDIETLLSSISVKRVKRSTTTGDVIGLVEEDWNATIPSNMLHAQSEAGAPASTTLGNIRVSLSPSSSQIDSQPGKPMPTDEIVVKYDQLSPAWEAGYRLERNSATNAPVLTGWLLFENQTGLNWNAVNIALVESSNSSNVGVPISLSGVSLPRQHGRLALQKPTPLDASVEPILVYDPTIDCCHPAEQTRISLSQSAPRGLPAGPVTFLSDGVPGHTEQFNGVAPGQSVQLAYPGRIELGMNIERNSRPVRTTFVGVCLRRGCFDYRERTRTLFFNVNHSNDYDGKVTNILFRLPGDPCWEQTAVISKLPAGSSIQQVEVEQAARPHSLKSIDLFSAPIDAIEKLLLDSSDPYFNLLKKVVDLRKSNDRKALDKLLRCPDLIVENVELICAPVKPGMVPDVLVTIRNIGGSACVFPSGGPIVAIDHFEQALAGPSPLILDACCSKKIRLRATGSVTASAKLSVLVDPAGKVAEATEDNNSTVFELRVVP